MIKKSSRIKYEYCGKQLNIKEIYSQNKKRRGRSKYLLSVDVKVGKEEPIAAKIVCVRNKANRNDWLLPLYALTQVCVKKRSFVFTEKDGK